MENNVDRYSSALHDLLIIANARIEAKAAANRIKQRLTVHEVSDKPRCDKSDATLALKQLLNDDLIGELVIHRPAGQSVERLKYKDFIFAPTGFDTSIAENGSLLITKLINHIGIKTIMEEIL